MDWAQLRRNVLFSIVLLVVVASISMADLPATDRVEEYIAYVLTTDFDYREWLGERTEFSFLKRIAGWRDALSRFGDEPSTVPAGPPSNGSVR